MATTASRPVFDSTDSLTPPDWMYRTCSQKSPWRVDDRAAAVLDDRLRDSRRIEKRFQVERHDGFGPGARGFDHRAGGLATLHHRRSMAHARHKGVCTSAQRPRVGGLEDADPLAGTPPFVTHHPSRAPARARACFNATLYGPRGSRCTELHRRMSRRGGSGSCCRVETFRIGGGFAATSPEAHAISHVFLINSSRPLVKFRPFSGAHDRHVRRDARAIREEF